MLSVRLPMVSIACRTIVALVCINVLQLGHILSEDYDSYFDRIHSSLTAVHCSPMVMWENSQWLGNNIVQSSGFKELQESMGRCTGDITEILLKTKLNTIQSINYYGITVLENTYSLPNISFASRTLKLPGI